MKDDRLRLLRWLPAAIFTLALSGCGGGETPATSREAPLAATAVHSDDDGHGHDDDMHDNAETREVAARSVRLVREGKAQPASTLELRILGFNDFHGQISSGRVVAGRPVGGAGVFLSYLKAASEGFENRTLIAHAGDLIGASPLSSALLRDEPTLAFTNLLGNSHCTREDRRSPRCNVVATPGNHEFDKGEAELLRQLDGGNHADGPFLDDPWPGANHPWISANIVRADSGKTLLRPWHIKRVSYADAKGRMRQMPVGFIGAVLRGTPSIVSAEGIRNLRFVDEAEAINAQVGALRRRGVETIVVLIHQGGFQTNYVGDTNTTRPTVGGEIVEIVNRLDPAIDLVISGHSHAFSNALVANAAGQPVLVTQAFANGTAYSEIDLKIDTATRDVVERNARIVTTWADAGPGLAPDARAVALTQAAEAAVAPLANRVVAPYVGDITRSANAAGESALGNLIADAQRATMATQIAFMNPGGIRADLLCAAGAVCNATYGSLFTVQPFGNVLTKMDLSGAQIVRLLEQQFQPVSATTGRVRFLQVSGLSYTWDNARVNAANFACSGCIVDVRDGNGAPLNPAASYSVTVNSFLADGGDGFLVLREGANRVGGPLDIDGLVAYLPTLAPPFSAPAVGSRIVRTN